MMDKVPGVEGFALVTYEGKAKETRKWIGPVTGVTYYFGGICDQGFVDVRDAKLFSDKLFKSKDLSKTVDLEMLLSEDAKKVPVRVIDVRGGSVLVECSVDGVLHRVYVPQWTIERGSYAIKRAPNPTVLDSILALAVPYGDDFEKIFADIPLDAHEFASQLHALGVWTVDDFQTKRVTVYNIIDRLLGLSDAIASAQSKPR